MEIKKEGKKVLDAAEKKLAGLTEVVTRKGWTKWLIVALAALVAVVVVMLLTSGKARATGMEHAVVKAVAVVATTTTTTASTVATTAAATHAATGAASSTPPAQTAVAGGTDALGPFVAFGVGLFMYATICTSERHRNREGWFARHCKPKWME